MRIFVVGGTGAPGIYNIVDDEPASVAVWLPFRADTVGARPPWKIPPEGSTTSCRIAIGAASIAESSRGFALVIAAC